MNVSPSLQTIYRAAGDLTRHHIDDVASGICVRRVRAFGSARPIAFHGPVRGFIAGKSSLLDSVAVATAAIDSGQAVPLSMTVHTDIPRFGDNPSLINVAELNTADGRATYWFAAPSDREDTLGRDTPVLLRGQGEAPDVALFGGSLIHAFQTRLHGAQSEADALLQSLLATVRDRSIGTFFPATAVMAIAARQDLIAKSAATSHAQRLLALGAPRLVVLRVTRDDLLGHADGPIAEAVADNLWAVHQPHYDKDHRITDYVAGQQGVLMLAHDFGTEPTRLLCLDASKLEFAVAGQAGFRIRLRPARGAVDPLSSAMDRSADRETEILARGLTQRNAPMAPLARRIEPRRAMANDLVR